MAKDEFGPVEPDNLPRSRRPDPDEDERQAPAKKTAAKKAPAAKATKAAKARPVDDTETPRRLSLSDIMRGSANPYRRLTQSGVRLPAFLQDAIRAVVQLSGGELTAQHVISEAVEQYLPDEVLREAWIKHGGAPDEFTDRAKHKRIR